MEAGDISRMVGLTYRQGAGREGWIVLLNVIPYVEVPEVEVTTMWR